MLRVNNTDVSGSCCGVPDAVLFFFTQPHSLRFKPDKSFRESGLVSLQKACPISKWNGCYKNRHGLADKITTMIYSLDFLCLFFRRVNQYFLQENHFFKSIVLFCIVRALWIHVAFFFFLYFSQHAEYFSEFFV